MNKPPYKRNKTRTGRNRKKAAKRPVKHRVKQLAAAGVLLLGFSLLQYLNTGTVSWPAKVFQNSLKELQDFAERPAASWRQATESLENLGAAREGQPIPEYNLVGRVVRVADGDTVSVLDHSNTQHKVRLFGIDTPERDQPHGKTSTRALARWVADKTVGVVVVDVDEYGRTVGTLYQKDTNINVAMVAAGHAWWYQHYAPHNRLLATSEQRAREQQKGLWATPNPISPWDWRRGQR
jgi:endonuclease YncB( thermonuclease family)